MRVLTNVMRSVDSRCVFLFSMDDRDSERCADVDVDVRVVERVVHSGACTWSTSAESRHRIVTDNAAQCTHPASRITAQHWRP